MVVFDKYAGFYDLYYTDKDYEGEVDFVLSLASQYGLAKPKSVLDIGCGTAGHIIPLCKRGIKAKGFDLSKKMIELAKHKISNLKAKAEVIVEVGDAITYNDGNNYDLVISMFACMGYLTTNEKFLAGLKTARTHLNENGIFIFDVWFGPAVLHKLPETRIQEFKKDGIRVLRLVRPKLDVSRQIVIIDYNILTFKGENKIQEIKEIHRMRYFFAQELKLFLENAGFELAKICPFLNSQSEPSLNDWNISVVAKARSSKK